MQEVFQGRTVLVTGHTGFKGELVVSVGCIFWGRKS